MKVDLQIQLVEMDIYVAPTVINLENPTFWISAAADPRGGNPSLPTALDDHFTR